MNTQASPAGPKRRLPWTGIALVISLGVNLLLIGMAAGHWTHRHDGHWGSRFAGKHGAEGRAHGMMRAFPEELRGELEGIMRERRAQAEPVLEQLRAARREAREALRAEPFDAARLAAAYAEMRRHGDTLEEAFHQAMIDAAGRLSPEARRKLSEMRWGPGSRGGMGGPGR
ncbi:MAG: periplasmic heavy metal sensor [Alphaproteobacteria bacterium]|nr:periplasmic heavy metal sensor [Alphaproteobacteria bacterium]